MAHEVYEIEVVRKRVLDLLRAEDRYMTGAAIGAQLGLPCHAVDAGLDSARTAGLAEYSAGVGWCLAVPAGRGGDGDDGFADEGSLL